MSTARAGAIWQGGARALAQAGSGAGEEMPVCSDEAWSPSTTANSRTEARTALPCRCFRSMLFSWLYARELAGPLA